MSTNTIQPSESADTVQGDIHLTPTTNLKSGRLWFWGWGSHNKLGIKLVANYVSQSCAQLTKWLNTGRAYRYIMQFGLSNWNTMESGLLVVKRGLLLSTCFLADLSVTGITDSDTGRNLAQNQQGKKYWRLESLPAGRSARPTLGESPGLASHRKADSDISFSSYLKRSQQPIF